MKAISPKGVSSLLILATALASLAASGCGFGAAKTTPAKQSFAVSKNQITLNKKSTKWPATYATVRAMLGNPDRTTKVDIINTTIYTWDKHGITAHREDNSKHVTISFWFHDNAGHFKWCPYKTAKGVVINGVSLTSTSSQEDLEKAGFKLGEKHPSRLDLKLALGTAGVIAQYHTDYLAPIDNHGIPQFKGLDNIGVGDE